MENSISIFIGGDYCPIGRNEPKIEAREFDSVLGEMKSSMTDVDLNILNLESPLTISQTPISKSGPNIKGKPEAIELLKFAGVNLVTLANNHIMDYGVQGLKDTLNICRKNDIHTVGAGLSREDAIAPFVFTKGGQKLAIINLAENEFNKIGESGSNTIDFIDNFYQIKKAKEMADIVMVIAHGGREHYQLPTPNVRERYRFFTDAGADIVIAHHPHCYSGYELYNGKPIFYSLGNFLFDYKKKYQRGLWTEAFALKLQLSPNGIEFNLIPFFQGRETQPSIELMKGEDERNFYQKITELNDIIKDDAKFFHHWEKYLETQKKAYISVLQMPNKYIRFLQAKGLFPQIPLSKPYKNILLNMNRCETHHEILKSVLEK